MERGTVSMRVAFVLRSAEVQPLFRDLCDVAADCACRESSILYTYLSWRHCWTLCCQFTPIPHNATQHNTMHNTTRKTTRKTSWSYAACTTNTTSLQKCYACCYHTPPPLCAVLRFVAVQRLSIDFCSSNSRIH